MSDVKAFLDTNLFVYLYSDSDITKKESVIKAINQYERFISTQIINEFCNVCIRKLSMPIIAVRKAVAEICENCNLVMVDDTTASAALNIYEKYGYSFYDCLIIVSALESRCRFLLSEDMADGQTIEGVLTIKNIFQNS